MALKKASSALSCRFHRAWRQVFLYYNSLRKTAILSNQAFIRSEKKARATSRRTRPEMKRNRTPDT